MEFTDDNYIDMKFMTYWFNILNWFLKPIYINDYKELVEQINKAVDQFRIDLVKVKENPLNGANSGVNPLRKKNWLI